MSSGASSSSCTIASETFATVPSNRKRKKVGVGEKVTLTFSGNSAPWTTTGGTLSATSGKSVTWTAPKRAAQITITAVGSNCTASIDFAVVEPSGATIPQKPNTGVWHDHNTASVGFKGLIFLEPVDVSFINIQFRENGGVVSATGCLAFLNGTPHQTGPWGNVVDGTSDTSGSQIQGATDTIWIGPISQPFNTGGMLEWPIHWQFRVALGSEKTFIDMVHAATIDSSGNATVSKGGTSKSKAYADPDSTY